MNVQPKSDPIDNYEPYNSVKLDHSNQGLFTGIICWHLWLTLAIQDVKVKYRRSILGPGWITFNTAVVILLLGFLYSHLFHIQTRTYFPYLATGIIAWNFISSLANESASAFIDAQWHIKNMSLNYSIFILRTVARNIIIFLHNLVVIIVVLLISHSSISLNIILLIPSLILVIINAYFYGYILAMLSARFRDAAPAIATILQALFFITPIMWNLNSIPKQYTIFLKINPFFYFVNLIRNPILGDTIGWKNFSIVVCLTIIGVLLAMTVFQRYRTSLVLWL